MSYAMQLNDPSFFCSCSPLSDEPIMKQICSFSLKNRLITLLLNDMEQTNILVFIQQVNFITPCFFSFFKNKIQNTKASIFSYDPYIIFIIQNSFIAFHGAIQPPIPTIHTPGTPPEFIIVKNRYSYQRFDNIRNIFVGRKYLQRLNI